jgi:hypothetical protein
LGADGSERVAKFESLRDLYKAHSQAAHKGTLKQELLVLLCHKIANYGMWPIPDSSWGRQWICGPRRVWRRVLLSSSNI